MTVPSQRRADRARRRLRAVAVVVTVSLYTVLAPVGYACFALAAMLMAGDPTARARRLQAVSCRAYRVMFAWLRTLRIAIYRPTRGLPGVPDGACVVVANHPGLMDVCALLACLGRGFTVAKPALFRRRALRPLLDGAGHVEGPGDDPAATGRVVERAVARLGEGFPLVIFPEGTRTVAGRMLPFGRAAFEIACRARVPLVSVGIRCEPPWLSKERGLFDPPDPAPRLTLTVLAVDDPASVDYDSRRLRRAVEDRFRRWLSEGRPSARPEHTTPQDAPSAPAPEDPAWPTSSKTA